MINIEKTGRGFLRGEFSDLYGEKCSIQESSLATEDAIWLGADDNRMHLDRNMATNIVMHLQRFIETGRL